MPNYLSPELAQIEVTGTTRAAFLARATFAAGALVGAGSLSPFVTGALAKGGGDLDILNYALTLEYLESAFYEQAVARVSMSQDVSDLAKEIRDNEAEHVSALRAAIASAGGKPVKRPGVRFGGAFANEQAFLKMANVFEDTGVSAYNGAAPMIKSKDILTAAGTIVQIEARHAALIRLQRGKPPAPQAFDPAASMGKVRKAVAPFLA
jgi:hypothetical protein